MDVVNGDMRRVGVADDCVRDWVRGTEMICCDDLYREQLKEEYEEEEEVGPRGVRGVPAVTGSL